MATNILTPKAPGSQGNVIPTAKPAPTGPTWNPKMGPPKNYNEWVSYHQQTGDYIANDPARQTAYHTYAAAHGLPTPWVTPGATGATGAAVAPPGTFTLDAQALQELGDAGSAYQQATGIDPKTGLAVLDAQGRPVGGGLAQNRDTALAQILAEREQNKLSWMNADRGVKGNAAGRGLFNGGWRRFQMDQNLAGMQRNEGLLGQRDANANNDFLRGTTAAEGAWQNAQTNIPLASKDRQMLNWYATRGL